MVKNPGEKFAPEYNLSWSDFKRGMNESDLNAQILKAIQSYAKNSGFKETFVAIKVSSDKWYMIRNSVTGAVLGRYVVAYCRAKWPDGKCTVQKFSFRQDYQGTSYGQAYCEGVYWNSAPKSIDCD